MFMFSAPGAKAVKGSSAPAHTAAGFWGTEGDVRPSCPPDPLTFGGTAFATGIQMLLHRAHVLLEG